MFLLWFDDTKKKTVEQKILEGVERYLERFGERPNVCVVHRGAQVPALGIEIREAEYVRPNYFWIGLEDNEPSARAA